MLWVGIRRSRSGHRIGRGLERRYRERHLQGSALDTGSRLWQRVNLEQLGPSSDGQLGSLWRRGARCWAARPMGGAPGAAASDGEAAGLVTAKTTRNHRCCTGSDRGWPCDVGWVHAARYSASHSQLPGDVLAGCAGVPATKSARWIARRRRSRQRLLAGDRPGRGACRSEARRPSTKPPSSVRGVWGPAATTQQMQELPISRSWFCVSSPTR